MHSLLSLTAFVGLILSSTFYLFFPAPGRASIITPTDPDNVPIRQPEALAATMSGPNCLVYPFTTPQSVIDSATPGQIIDIFEGAGNANFGWVSWNPDNNIGAIADHYLEDELTNPQLSLNDYTNARDAADHILDIDDWVASMPGTKTAVESSEGLVSALIGQEIIIPIWDTFDLGTGGEVDAYHIVNFALVRIDDPADIDLLNKTVFAVYLQTVAIERCPYLTISKSGPVTATIGSPITYTLTLTNSGNLTATNLSITDVIPTNAGYLSGGTLVSNTVVWTIPGLNYSNSLTRMFSVIANQTITNSDYFVSADGNISATGTVTVVTTISGVQLYLPLILKDS